MFNPGRSEFYIPIPKNGTNSLRATLYEWQSEDLRQGRPDIPGWVFIRNPVDRWFSGLKEATFHHGYGRTWEEMIRQAYEGRFVWDNHTRPQAEIIAHAGGVDGVELVKFDRASQFIQERYGREFAWERHRFWDREPALEPAIINFYAEDVELYEKAT